MVEPIHKVLVEEGSAEGDLEAEDLVVEGLVVVDLAVEAEVEEDLGVAG